MRVSPTSTCLSAITLPGRAASEDCEEGYREVRKVNVLGGQNIDFRVLFRVTLNASHIITYRCESCMFIYVCAVRM